MNDNPKVTIVIPVYNGSKYMQDAINSALLQTYKNIEVIVVNDGSNDDGKTDHIAKSYGKKINYFVQKNGGVSSALNLGIKNMTGKYFSWLSHDDIYDRDKIQVQIDFLNNIGMEDVILYSDYKVYNENFNLKLAVKLKQYKSSSIRFGLITSANINFCSALIPRKCFEIVGLFNEKLRCTPDGDMLFRLSEKFEYFYVPKSLVIIRSHHNQVSYTNSNMDREQNDFYIDCLKKISVIDLLAMSGEESVSLVYAKLAWDFKEKKYIRTSCYAKKLSRKYLRKDNNLEAKKIIYKLDVSEDRLKLYKKYCFQKSFKYLNVGKNNIKLMFNRIQGLYNFILAIIWYPLNVKAWIYFIVTLLPKNIIYKLIIKMSPPKKLYYI